MSVRVIQFFLCCPICVLTSLDLCCDVRYDLHMKTMFSSSLPPSVCRKASVLFTLFVFVYEEWCPTQIDCVVLCFVLLSFVLCTLCCYFLRIDHL